MGFWGVVRRVLEESDVILLVLDARMPEMTNNRELLEKIQYSGKKYALVFSKIDLIDKKELGKLRRAYQKAFFVSIPKRQGVNNLKRYLENLGERVNVGILGYPNVGKSSLINSISGKRTTKISNVAGTTKGSQWINLGKIKIIDSPGVIPFEDGNVKLGLIGAKNPEKLKNPLIVAIKIIRLMDGQGKQLAEYYNVGNEKKEEDLIEKIGRKKGFLMKGGEVDLSKTAISIIRDWQNGKIGA